MFDQTPNNLPISKEPEDILEKVAPVAPARPAAPPPPPRPAAPSGKPNVSVLPPVLPREAMTIETPHQGMKRFIFILGIILGLGIVGGVSWFFISRSLKKTAPVTPPAVVTPPPAEAPVTPTEVIPPPTEIPVTPPAVVTPPPAAPAVIDTDGDGLSDAEEARLGTNPNLIDTDNDGLTDFEEVNVYHTDPLKADTDGDGFSDGHEVRGGYDPLVPGK